jgi:8-oxo-dGTP diphosphatase
MENLEYCPVVQVAVGVVRNGRGEILIARRHDHLHQGGLWEFPGGKVEPLETVEAALRRELCEELAITVQQATPLIKIHHHYGDKRVLLDVWRVDAYLGDPQGQENQPILWVSPAELNLFDFPAANRPIVAAARLPEYYPIVDGGLADGEALFAKLERLCQTGYTLAQWRVKDTNTAAYLKLTRSAVDYCRPRGLGLLLNADPDRVMPTGAAGVHLNSRRLLGLTQRPLPPALWVAASCHNLMEIRHAEKTGVDFVLLSPVLATPSHPNAQPLGWDRFSAWVDLANVPVFALGGMARDHLAQARQQGAQGVAGIRGFDDA